MSELGLKLYQSFGIVFKENSTQGIATCPYCHKDEKFYVSKKTGQYNCKSCGEKGNKYAYLQHYHDARLQKTTVAKYRELFKARGIPAPVLKEAKLAFDKDQDRWMLPVWNGSENVVNCMLWNPKDKRNPMKSTVTCARHLYRANDILPEGPIFVCEGEWDTLALLHLLQKIKMDKEVSVVGTPGSETFKDEWIKLFKGRDVFLVYDNDNAGFDGMQKVSEKLQPIAKSVSRLSWPPNSRNKMDIRDLVKEFEKDPVALWELLKERLINDTKEAYKPKIQRTTFSGVLKDFKKVLKMTPSMETTLAMCFATILSTKSNSNPLWAFIVGPPGCGKSTILLAFEGSHDTVFRSKLTAKSLLSGMKMDNGDDPSLLDKLPDKTLIIKDYTAVKSMPEQVQEEMYGILRDAYDGFVNQSFGNNEYREYKGLHFSLIAGVTDRIHEDQRASLGERFLKINMLEESYNQDDPVRASIENTIGEIRPDKDLMESVRAFLWHLGESYSPENLPKPTTKQIDQIVALSHLVSSLRATVARGKHNDITYRSRPELGTRVGSQLVKTAQFLAFVLGKPKIDHEVMRTVVKTGLDTVTGWHQDLCRALIDEEGLTVDMLAKKAQISPASATRRLEDLQELRITRQRAEKKSSRGRPVNIWSVSRIMKQWWSEIKQYVGDDTVNQGKPRRRGKK